MLCIVGLGNPEEVIYKNNRHNIGSMVINSIWKGYCFPSWKKKFKSLISEKSFKTSRVLLVKPQNFMNNSGFAIEEILRFYKICLKNLLVIHDDLNLSKGKFSFKKNGGSGGHNGIRSIDDRCGKDYFRLRIGIGHPGNRDIVQKYVLNNFLKEDFFWINPLLENFSKKFFCLLKENNI